MQAGQTIKLYEAGAEKHRTAEVVAVVGHGRTNRKRLDVLVRNDGKDEVVKGVYHQLDAPEGEGFWLLKDERLHQLAPTDEAAPKRKRAKRPPRKPG